MNQKYELDRAYYLKHSPMTDPGKNKDMVANLPKDVSGIVKVVQNALIHQHIAAWVYGIELDEERQKEPWIRSVEDKLEWLKEHGYKNIQDPHPMNEHMVGICRDFSVLAASLLCEVGIPARARCGSATYLEPDRFSDHWVCEYWNADRNIWQLVDAQLDAAQQEKMKIQFDSMDVPRDVFLTAPAAWKLARSGKEDPMKFGILNWWGYDALGPNLILDVNSLFKAPFQPWDGWYGYKMMPSGYWFPGDWKKMDKLAELAEEIYVNLDALYHFVNSHERIKVPDDWSKVKNLIARSII